MKFMLMVKGDADYEAGRPPRPEMIAAIGRVTEEAMKAGTLLETGGLQPSAKGARVRLAGGKLTVLDGPFAEAKEVVGGYAIFQLPSREAAIEQAKQFLELHRQVLGP